MQQKEELYIYCRVSTAEQAEKDLSLPRQQELGRKLAEELNMAPVIFIEPGESASQENFDNRPELMKILGLVKEGKVKHLFIFDQSRLSRNDITKAIISESLRKSKVKVYTHSKRFDFDKVEDVLTFKILEAIETYESSLRKTRFKLGYITANKKGRFLKGIPPYGYQKSEDGMLVIDPEEKAVLLQMISWYLKDGFGTNKIAELLNHRLVPTKTSKVLHNGYTLKKGISNRRFDTHKVKNEWNAGTINSILKSEVLYGKRKFKIADGVFEYVECEPIIDKATFDRIQQVRRHNAINKKKEDKYFYLLKDLCVCGNCGHPLHGRVKPNRGEFLYRCNSRRNKAHTCSSRSINIDKLNNVIWQAYRASSFYHQFINDKILFHLGNDMNDERRLKALEDELVAIKKQEEALESKLKRLLKQEVDARISKKVFNQVLDEIQAEQRENEDNKTACRANIRAVSSALQNKGKAMSDIAKGALLYGKAQTEIGTLYPSSNKQNQLEARKILKSAITNIVVTYQPEMKKHVIEIMFNKLAVKAEGNKSEIIRIERVKNRSVEVGLREKVNIIPLPDLSSYMLLKDNEGFKKKYERFIAEEAKKKSKKWQTPLFVQRKMWHW